jgi:hypothetical protein
MRRILPLAALLAAALPVSASAQIDRGGFVTYGQGGGGTTLLAPRFSLDAGYVVEVSEGNGPYVAGRYTFGFHRLRADAAGFEKLYGAGELEGGDGTLYDTGADVEAGYQLGVLRVYGFTGLHFYQQFQDPATLSDEGGEREVYIHSRQSIANARGGGVQLRLTDTGAIVAEYYRGGGEDGVMRLKGTRFGVRWAW